jgi:hypothetical protein
MGDSAPKQQRREVQVTLQRLRKQIGKLTLEVAPDGAIVRVDGAEERRAPLLEPLVLHEGKHEVEVRHPGYATVRKEVEIPGGGSASLSV